LELLPLALLLGRHMSVDLPQPTRPHLRRMLEALPQRTGPHLRRMSEALPQRTAPDLRLPQHPPMAGQVMATAQGLTRTP
jgi:hypothetical protein